jgi:hypothetical protein
VYHYYAHVIAGFAVFLIALACLSPKARSQTHEIVREKNPDPTGTRAHICESGGYVFCFVPPFGGM